MKKSVSIGSQLCAPNGLGSLVKGTRYYYAGRGNDGRILLVWFAKHKIIWRAHCIRMDGEAFEKALLNENESLVPCDKQWTVPEWLLAEEGKNYDELDAARKKKVQTYRQQVEARLLKIAPALQNEKAILNAEDPLKALAAYAYTDSEDRTKHPHRIQLWFFAYILHGKELWALKQPTGGCGKWSRQDDEHADTKFGRGSLDSGAEHGWPSAPMRPQIEKSYLARCGLGVSMMRIHREALREDFGCAVYKDEKGKYVIYHPENKPFPTYGQFRAVVISIFHLEAVQTTVWGAPRVRLHAVVEEGNYTQQFANILESMEVDAYFVSERPKAMNSDDAMPALGVARGICVTTGACVGVGFSLGSETSEAYQSMLFCAAVQKAYIARLYGIPDKDLHWIMAGVPASFKSDRGPAGRQNLVADLERRFPMKSITPSYSGQSKAVVESSHPRNINLEGPPSYVISDLNLPQMVNREIYRAAADNHTSDISSRLSDEMIHIFRQEGRVATPHNYWEVLEARFRTSAHSMTIHQAVRAFWTPTEFKVDRNGVRYRHRYYTSEEFRNTGIQKRIAELADFKLKGYTLNMVTRYIHIEVNGHLIELEAARRTRIDKEEFFVPLSELEETADQLAILRSETRNSIKAAAVDRDAKFHANTGKSWSDGVRKQGTPKRPEGTTAHEVKVAKGKSSSRKIA